MSGLEKVYGVHAVRTLLERGADRVAQVFVAEQRDDARVKAIVDLAQRQSRPVKRVPLAQFQQFFGDATHQGVYAEVRSLEAWNEERLLDALTKRESPIVLVLDGVQDPHNLGACLRTADACGAVAVVVPKDRAAQMNATVRKVAAGAAETTPLVAVTNLARSLKLLKDAGLWIAGADAEAQGEAYEADLSGPIALVMGAEGTGLRQLTRQNCDFLVRLPQLGAVERLNVSVATGMLLYEAVRQRAGKKKPSEKGANHG